jgi:hypothetical protein
MKDVPLPDPVLVRMRYDIIYRFEKSSKSRRTSKLIEWSSRQPRGQPGPRGGSVAMPITVGFFDQIDGT